MIVWCGDFFEQVVGIVSVACDARTSPTRAIDRGVCDGGFSAIRVITGRGRFGSVDRRRSSAADLDGDDLRKLLSFIIVAVSRTIRGGDIDEVGVPGIGVGGHQGAFVKAVDDRASGIRCRAGRRRRNHARNKVLFLRAAIGGIISVGTSFAFGISTHRQVAVGVLGVNRGLAQWANLFCVAIGAVVFVFGLAAKRVANND